MNQMQFNMIFDYMCANWNKNPEKEQSRAMLLFGKFKHISQYDFRRMIDEIIDDTERQNTFPTVSQIRLVEKKTKVTRKRSDCVVCSGVGLVSMMHVFERDKPMYKYKPDFVRYSDVKSRIEIRDNENLRSYDYAYACLCGNATWFEQKRITQDQFDEIKKYMSGI